MAFECKCGHSSPSANVIRTIKIGNPPSAIKCQCYRYQEMSYRLFLLSFVFFLWTAAICGRPSLIVSRAFIKIQSPPYHSYTYCVDVSSEFYQNQIASETKRNFNGWMGDHTLTTDGNFCRWLSCCRGHLDRCLFLVGFLHFGLGVANSCNRCHNILMRAIVSDGLLDMDEIPQLRRWRRSQQNAAVRSILISKQRCLFYNWPKHTVSTCGGRGADKMYNSNGRKINYLFSSQYFVMPMALCGIASVRDWVELAIVWFRWHSPQNERDIQKRVFSPCLRIWLDPIRPAGFDRTHALVTLRRLRKRMRWLNDLNTAHWQSIQTVCDLFRWAFFDSNGLSSLIRC